MPEQRELITAGPVGLQVIASATSGGREPRELKMASDKCFVSALGFFWRKYECGHRGPRWFRISTWDEETKKIRNRERCPDCMLVYHLRVVIRCAVCGRYIAPGDPIALYSTSSKGLRVEIATMANDSSVIGCMRIGCCPSGGFFAGHWNGEKFVSSFNTSLSFMQQYTQERQ